MNKLVPHSLVHSISRSWELDQISHDREGDVEPALLAAIASRVRTLLRGDTDRLMNSLYRLDVAEAQVADAFRLGRVDEIATALAKLILQRERVRHELREKYAGSGNPPDPKDKLTGGQH